MLGGVSHPLQLTTGLVIKSVTTSPTLAGEHMLFILQVSIVGTNLNSKHPKRMNNKPKGSYKNLMEFNVSAQFRKIIQKCH